MKQPDDHPNASKYTAYLNTVNVVYVAHTVAVSFDALRLTETHATKRDAIRHVHKL